VFQNGGLIALLYIFLSKWNRGELLDESISMSLMAMIYFVFISVNGMTYYAMSTFQTFLAIVARMSSVFEMEEYQYIRETNVAPDDVKVEFINADITWGFKIKE